MYKNIKITNAQVNKNSNSSFCGADLEIGHGIKGYVTLQTSDAKTGKIIQDVSAGNFISQSTIRYMNWWQRSNYRTGLSALGSSDVDPSPSPVFSHIMLTSSTMAEDPANEWAMPGSLTGWADKTSYAGVDTLRGTPNITQVETNPEYTKWVFDWPTHAANGTIGSVGWGRAVSTAPFTINGSGEEVYTTFANWRYFTRANQILSFGQIGSAAAVQVLDGAYGQVTSFNANGQFTTIQGLAWDRVNSKLWVLGTNGANRQIASYTEAGVLVDSPKVLTARAYLCLAFDGTNLWTTVSSGTSIIFYKINQADGSDVSNFSYISSNSSGTHGLAWDPSFNRLWLKNGGVLSSFNTSGEKQTVDVSLTAWNSATGAGNNIGLSTANDFDVIDGYQFAIPYSASQIARFRPDGMGSRALLPTPVVKTDAQTLKLIYQINYS